MHIALSLPSPLNTFVVDLPAGEYKDFGLPPDSPYPLKGVTYPVDYGYLPGHIGEDGYELDLFVGNTIEGNMGALLVDRGADMPSEHKFYVALNDVELEEILTELKPVLISHTIFNRLELLLKNIANFTPKD